MISWYQSRILLNKIFFIYLQWTSNVQVSSLALPGTCEFVALQDNDFPKSSIVGVIVNVLTVMFPSGLVCEQKRNKKDDSYSSKKEKKTGKFKRKKKFHWRTFNLTAREKRKKDKEEEKKKGKEKTLRNLLVSLSFNNLLVKTTCLAILQLLSPLYIP